MCSGSDEHGTPITLTAEEKGVPPQEIVDHYHEINKKALIERSPWSRVWRCFV